MSKQALQKFVDELVVEMGQKSPVLRSDYNLQPHTFVFTPGRLGTQMIMAAKNSAKDGWELTNKDMAEIRKLAEKQGALLVNYIKSLGGKSYSKKGVKLMFTTSTDQEVLNPKWKRDRLPDSPPMFDQNNIYQKVKSAYSDTIEAFFESVQFYFTSQEETYTSKKTKRTRKKAIRTGKEGGGQIAGSAGAVIQAGHEHGGGILETQMRAAFNTTYDKYTQELQKEGIRSAQEMYRVLQGLGLNLSVVRADDGEGFVIMLEDKTSNIKAGQSAKAAKKEFIETASSILSKKLDTVKMLESSDSIVRRNRKLIIKSVAKEFKKNRRVKVKTEDTKLKKSKGGASATIAKPKIDTAKSIGLAAKIALPKGGKKQGKRRPPPPKMGVKNILGVLNNQLPERVASNMGEPRLVNRTGRFAQSVRATDVSQTAQGFPSIGYTYEKGRYGVFESTSGTSRASIERDPRPLIDQSIREIVIGFGLGRIYTRRQ
tara:strand:- start:257 stop:1711 length:1455 start_codon:yes stop_codon:yes gene_type:complete